MRPLLAIVIALTLVAVAAAVGLFAGEHRPPGDAASPAPAATVSASAPAKATVAPAAKARAGRVLPLPDAIRELELIKPARSKRAEDFSLDTPGSGKVRLLDYRGQVVLINFWATWCSPCKREIPWLVEFQTKYKDRGFTVLGLSVDEDGWTSVASYLDAAAINYPVAIATDEVTAGYGGITAVPMSFVIDRNGRVAATHLGLLNRDDVEAEIVSALGK